MAWSGIAIRAALRAKAQAVLPAECPSGQGKQHLLTHGILQQQTALLIITDFRLVFGNRVLPGLGIYPGRTEDEVEVVCKILLNRLEATRTKQLETPGEICPKPNIFHKLTGPA